MVGSHEVPGRLATCRYAHRPEIRPSTIGGCMPTHLVTVGGGEGRRFQPVGVATATQSLSAWATSITTAATRPNQCLPPAHRSRVPTCARPRASFPGPHNAARVLASQPPSAITGRLVTCRATSAQQEDDRAECVVDQDEDDRCPGGFPVPCTLDDPGVDQHPQVRTDVTG